MPRLTDNDRNWGPFTFARWKKRLAITLEGEDGDGQKTQLLFVGFGFALRIHLPFRIKAVGKYEQDCREYGFALTSEDKGFDFLQVFYGPQTYDSSTSRSWSKSLPWKMWDHVRTTIYRPDGTPFAEEEKGKWREFFEKRDACPKIQFEFEDYDGTRGTATCMIEEREWHRGWKPFRWLRFFYPAKIRRSMDIRYDREVGPEKGSWKGGTIGTGIDLREGETPQDAFKRFCEKDHRSKYRSYRIKFICEGPPEKPSAVVA
jgi:hypothetical protein